jgi:predicted choloylglycine hydrolase
LLLFTDPPDGYASVSMVDISYLGYNQEETGWQERRDLLRAPYWPFDGMNSAGLAVGMMAVSEADTGADPQKATLSDLQIIRLLLDNAANMEQAVELLGSYNIDFGGGPPVHYLIADSSGSSAVVEFVRGEMHVLTSQQSWQVATNFLISVENPQGADSSCWRYNQAYEVLEQSEGQISESEAMRLLEDVSQGGDYPTIWSVVYNLSAATIHIAVGREYTQVYDFTLAENTARYPEDR